MSKQIKCGGVLIGGGAPISIQSMTNVSSTDERALVNQILTLEEAGCDIVRMAVPNMEAADALKLVKKQIHIPLVADIHFDYRLAIAAIEAGADKVRINPGNIGSVDRVKAVVDKAKERQIPIRIGVNSGSLDKELVAKYGGVTAEGLAERALNNLKLIEDLGYDNLVVSLKSSDVMMNYRAHKIVAAKTDYPIHIGITEAGTLARGKTKSAIGIGALLLDGIGDTMRVSLTADPVEEIKYAKEILKTLGLRNPGINYVSCPTCGRTKIDLERLIAEIETKLTPVEERIIKENKRGITVAVMGCAVNGPGEAKEADYGVAGGDGKGIIFKKGEIVKTVKEEEIPAALLELID